MKRTLLFLFLFCITNQLAKGLYLGDGQEHDVNTNIGPLVVDYNSSHIGTTVNIWPGAIIYELDVWDDCTVNMFGGTIQAPANSFIHGGTFNIYGGSISFIQAMNLNSQINIYGTGFSVDGSPIPYGRLYGISKSCYYGDEPIRKLTGALTSGEILDVNFRILCNNFFALFDEGLNHTLTVLTEPNKVNTVMPSIGEHIFSGLVEIGTDLFVDCPDVYQFDHWEGNVTDPNLADTTVFMNSDKTITAVFVDDRKCGDECHPYLPGDINKDCKVDIFDFVIIADSWLDCTRPECD